MFKKLFSKSATSKGDVVMAAAAALIGVWKAVDTYRDYKSEQENQEIAQ